jgi:hypothetical protein
MILRHLHGHVCTCTRSYFQSNESKLSIVLFIYTDGLFTNVYYSKFSLLEDNRKMYFGIR